MKTTFTYVALAVALVTLVGCEGRESVTGLPFGGGSRALAGQVVPVGDLAGSSPSGITVSASGQVAVTDNAGQFMFPALAAQDVQLTFSRQDGINARGTVSATASEVQVHLQKSQASIVVTGQSKREIEGLILEISSTSITVDDARTHGPVKAAITPATVIRKGNQNVPVADLKVGDRVHVKASVNADSSLTAFEIMLQQSGNGNGNQTRQLEGPIIEITAISITVNNASSGPETATITGATVIRKGNEQLTWDKLKPGDRVHVKARVNADGSLTATEIMLQNPGV
jgi:uncharacterized lipoprotein NlpE involved in copper resistance